jgi:hypothetical protein
MMTNFFGKKTETNVAPVIPKLKSRLKRKKKEN